MTLSEKQQEFTRCVGRLIAFADSLGLGLTFGDAYAQAGHMVGSCHYSRLAVDFNLFIDGRYRPDSEAHRPLGEHWKALHPLARWGGDFKRNDGNHYSFEHEGRA